MAFRGKIIVAFFSPLYQILAHNIEGYLSVANLMLHCLLTVRHTLHFREHCDGMATLCTGHPSGDFETLLGWAQYLRKLKSH